MVAAAVPAAGLLVWSRCAAVLLSPIFGRIEPRQIVEWMLADKVEARFQLQMHKFIWPAEKRGV